MKKSGIVITVGIILFCMGTKFNSVAMNRPGLMTSSGLDAADRARLEDQLKTLDAEIAKKEQELEQAGRFEEFAIAKELNALRKKRSDTASMFTLDVVLDQPGLREAIPANQCQLRPKFVEFLYLKTVQYKVLQFNDWVESVAWSPDGSKLAVGSRGLNGVSIWDTTAGTQIGQNLQTGPYFQSFAWSPDGSKLAIVSGEMSTVTIWDVSTRAQVGPNLQQLTGIKAVAWSPDGTKLATGSNDYTAKIWNAITGAQIGSDLQHGIDLVFAVAFSPDGTKLATGSGTYPGRAKIWNVATGARIGPDWQWGEYIRSVAWSPDGKKLATNGKIWDVATGAPVAPNLKDNVYYKVESAAWSPDGSKLAMGYEVRVGKAVAKIWDIETGAQVGPDLQHANDVKSVAWSPDGSKLATGSSDKTVKIWNTININPNFLAKLNLDQCELLQAFDLAIQQKGRIQATQDQWYTFTTFPKAVQDALRLYIKPPAAEPAPVLEESERTRMEERIGKALDAMWAREKEKAQKK